MDKIGTNVPTLKHFRFWCYKVLPLVYDDSLSYYEVLCKVVKYINDLIDQDKVFGETLDSLQAALKEVQDWIENFDTSYIENLIAQYLAKMIYVYISDAGYFIYYIPESWSDITFNTTGLDISDAELIDAGHIAGFEYGHLVLSFWEGEETNAG